MSRPRHWLDAVVDALRFDRLDRYVCRYFFSSVFVVFVFFFGFFMVIDLFANADEFVDNSKKFNIAARTMAQWVAGYYLYKSPSVFLQVAPFVTVIGGIVAIARMNRFNEIVPVLMSGRSVFRMLRPVFVCASALMVFMLLVQEWVAPAASDRRLAYYSFLRKGSTAIEVNENLVDAAGFKWAGLRYDALGRVLELASVLRVEGARVESIDLSQARYVELAADGRIRRGWAMQDGVPVTVYEGTSKRERTLDLFETSVTPRLLTARAKEPFDLSFAELGFLFGLTRQARFQVLLHYHLTFPLTNLLLLLLAVPFVLRYDRQHVMQGLAIAFFLCVAYFGVDSALRTLGEHKLHPILAAWFAPLFFGALGISLFDGVRT